MRPAPVAVVVVAVRVELEAPATSLQTLQARVHLRLAHSVDKEEQAVEMAVLEMIPGPASTDRSVDRGMTGPMVEAVAVVRAAVAVAQEARRGVSAEMAATAATVRRAR
jgi:hypothetical protein